METKVAEGVIANVNLARTNEYKQYWESVTPKTAEERYWRFIFAILSPKATWKSNALAYDALRNSGAWNHSFQALSDTLLTSGLGLHKVKAERLWLFKWLFWENPDWWKKQENESWAACRERITGRCPGLGRAKASFALELCYPLEAEVVCLDVHMLRLYGLSDKPAISQYMAAESHWLAHCKNIGSYIVRCAYWDDLQKKLDSRYWSYVLEE